MSTEVTIPRLGWSMEEGIFLKWLKRDGDWVNRGDQLFLLESDKATQEIESLDEGHLRISPNAPQPGDTVKVGQVIGFLVANKTGATPLQGASPENDDPGPAPAAGPAVRRLARQLNVELAGVTGTGPSGRITADDVQAEAARRSLDDPRAVDRAIVTSLHDHANSSEPIGGESTTRARHSAITPRARHVARELGVDPGGATGSGRGGRIRERDVRAAARQQSAAAVGQPALEQLVDGQIKSGSVRRTIARRMVASHQTTAPVTLTSKVDASNLVSLRNQLKTVADVQQDIAPTVTDLMVKFVAIALKEHPRLNARWEDERIIELAEVHVGIAVETDIGLVVPVLRNVRALGVHEIAVRVRELIAQARAGTLSASDLQGGTFTITNLGMYGIDAFTPIINPPESAILGLGAIRREPVCMETDCVVPRDMMTLSLTFDHRVVDGAPAARFLQTLRIGAENPAVWLIR